MCGQAARGRPVKHEVEEIDPVWKKNERQALESILDAMGYETIRPIRRGRTPRIATVVRRKTETYKSRYPKGLGGELPTYLLTFGPEAVLNLQRAVILELNRWGLLQSHTLVGGEQQETRNGYEEKISE